MIDHLDHLVLTSTQPDATIDFYTRVLGMQLERFGEGRIAFRFGNQKINLHVRGQEFEPNAHLPVPGALDLCFIASIPLDAVIERLAQANWPIVEGAPGAHRRHAADPLRLRPRPGPQSHRNRRTGRLIAPKPLPGAS